jgi:hypothetical protein
MERENTGKQIKQCKPDMMTCNTGGYEGKKSCRQCKVQGVLPPGRAFRYHEHSSAHRACECSIQSTTTRASTPHSRLDFLHINSDWGIEEGRRLTRSTRELLAEHEELGTVVDGQDTGTGNTTENVGTSSLEERLDTLSGNDLAGGIHGTLVLDGLTGGHHHTTTDGVERVRGDTGTGGDGPTKSERGQEVALKSTGKDDRLERVVHTEVETTVDDDTSNGGHETTVKTTDTVGSEGLLVDIGQSVELALTTLLGGLGVVGKTGTGVVEGVDEEEGSGTSGLLLSAIIKDIKGKDDLHHRRPSYRPSTWRNRHAPSCRRTWTCRCRGKRSSGPG